jgi:hypothetical protein
MSMPPNATPLWVAALIAVAVGAMLVAPLVVASTYASPIPIWLAIIFDLITIVVIIRWAIR